MFTRSTPTVDKVRSNSQTKNAENVKMFYAHNLGIKHFFAYNTPISFMNFLKIDDVKMFRGISQSERDA
jgi:hypothetical protein